jgi:hypothetical protein
MKKHKSKRITKNNLAMISEPISIGMKLKIHKPFGCMFYTLKLWGIRLVLLSLKCDSTGFNKCAKFLHLSEISLRVHLAISIAFVMISCFQSIILEVLLYHHNFFTNKEVVTNERATCWWTVTCVLDCYNNSF